MKAILKVVVVAEIFLTAPVAPQTAGAQGSVTYLSNLGQAPVGNNSVGSDSWLAALFYTGNNSSGYFLNSVQLAMTDASGNPSGFTVMIYSGPDIFGGNLPGSSIGTMTGSANPATAGIYAFNAPSGLMLSSLTPYFIVVTSGTAVSTGAYRWSLSGTDSYNPTGGWGVIQGVSSGVFDSSNGSSWTSLSATYPQFAINATAAPEPGVVGLFALGGLLIGFRRRKANRPGCVPEQAN